MSEFKIPEIAPCLLFDNQEECPAIKNLHEAIPEFSKLQARVKELEAEVSNGNEIADMLVSIDENHPAITLPDWAKCRKNYLRCQRDELQKENEAEGVTEAINAIKQRLEKATPGPWIVRAHPALGQFVEAPGQHPKGYGQEILAEEEYPRQKEDHEFVAHSRTDIERLLKVVGLLDCFAPAAVRRRVQEILEGK